MLRSKNEGTPIEELKLPVRTYNALRRTNILDIATLVETWNTDKERLGAIRNFGIRSFVDVYEGLIQYGYEMTDDKKLVLPEEKK